MIGRTKASVLPVPVCAVATRSSPASAGSIGRGLDRGSYHKAVLARLRLSEEKTEIGQRNFSLFGIVGRKIGR